MKFVVFHSGGCSPAYLARLAEDRPDAAAGRAPDPLTLSIRYPACPIRESLTATDATVVPTTAMRRF